MNTLEYAADARDFPLLIFYGTSHEKYLGAVEVRSLDSPLAVCEGAEERQNIELTTPKSRIHITAYRE